MPRRKSNRSQSKARPNKSNEAKVEQKEIGAAFVLCDSGTGSCSGDTCWSLHRFLLFCSFVVGVDSANS